MLGYGFSIPSNPYDHYAVGFRVPPDSPLAEVRAWHASEAFKMNKKSKAEEDYRYYLFNTEHPRARSGTFLETSIFSQDLFDSLSILSANIRELECKVFRSSGFILDRDPKRFADKRKYRNLLHTLFQLRLECTNRSEMLRRGVTESDEVFKNATSQKQQYAMLYRDGQLAILETAAVLCRYCLLRTSTPQTGDSDLLASAAAAEGIALASEATHNVQKLLKRTKLAINGRTLFKFAEAVDLLPESLAKNVHHAAEACVTGIVKKASSSLAQQPVISNDIPEKVGFTIFLASLRKVYSESSVGLPSHLRSWMRDLGRWYPFEDTFWNGPTEEFLPTLEALMEATDLIKPDTTEPVMDGMWCDPRMLCWGWNVQEEEGLFTETETPRTNGDGAACQPSKYLLCIPGVPDGDEVPESSGVSGSNGVPR